MDPTHRQACIGRKISTGRPTHTGALQTPQVPHETVWREQPDLQAGSSDTLSMDIRSANLRCPTNPLDRCRKTHPAQGEICGHNTFPGENDCLNRTVHTPRETQRTTGQLDTETHGTRKEGFPIHRNVAKYSTTPVTYSHATSTTNTRNITTRRQVSGRQEHSPWRLAALGEPGDPIGRTATTLLETQDNRNVGDIPPTLQVLEHTGKNSSVDMLVNAPVPQATPLLKSHVTGCYHRLNTHATQQEMALPLHTKPVRRVSLIGRLHQLEKLDPEMGRIFKRILDAIVDSKDEILDDQAYSPLTMELTQEDINTLLKAELIKKVNTQQRPNCRVFSVAELTKNRRRWICHTATTNTIENILAASCMKFTKTTIPVEALTQTPTKQIERVTEHFAACVDFASYFHQFALDPEMKLWCFQAQGKMYELETIPTGASFCPALAQIFSFGILRSLKKIHPHIKFDVYIDNVRISGNCESSVNDAMKSFYELCDQLMVDINEPLKETLASSKTSYDFLGIHFDHRKQETSLAPKLNNKISEMHIPRQGEHITIRRYLQMYGLLGYASGIMRIPRADFYVATKFLRRRIGRPLDELCIPWKTSIKALSQWKERILNCPPLHANKRENRATLFTDASNNGYGAVLISACGRVEIIAGSWTPAQRKLHINEKEALTVLLALEKMNLNDFGPKEIELRIDNTTALYSIVKGDSRSHSIAKIVSQIWSTPNWPKISEVRYVASADNNADLPSRLMPKHETHWISNSPFLLSQFNNHFGVTKNRR